MSKPKGPRFVQFFVPVLDALRQLGFSAKPKEVYAKVAELTKAPAEELEAVNKNGQSKFENRVAWARFYLVKAGFIDSEQRGVWVLTEAGRKARLDQDDSVQLFKRLHQQFEQERGAADSTDSRDPTEIEEGDSAPGTAKFLSVRPESS